MNKLKALPNFKKFMNGEEFTITEIFGCLQGVHNAATETAGHLAFLGCMLTSHPDYVILVNCDSPKLILYLMRHMNKKW